MAKTDQTDSLGALLGHEMKARRADLKMTQGQLAAAVWPGDSQAETARKGDISKIETGKVPNPQPATVKKIADALKISDDRIAELRRQAGRTAAERMEEIPTLSRNDLELLANRFEIEKPHDRSDADLRQLLTQKATEYRALRSEVEAIDDGLKRLSNLKSAAQDAIARVDLEEVEEILSRVQEVELEEAAKTAELRAENALLRGRVEQAYQLYCATADSFAAVDPLEPARRRDRYGSSLYRYGLRYGGTGLQRAIDIVQPAVTESIRAADADLWAKAKNNLAIALQAQGTRTGGPEGAALLAEAVAAYRAALTVYTKANHPVDWGTTQNNLAIALQAQGTRTGGPEGAALLAEAVAAYRAALTVRTKADHPVDWAMTQNNLAAALRNQGTRTGGPEGAALLAEAVAAYRAALTVRTKADHPVEWAMTQNNLAIALTEQGTRTGEPEGAALLAEAVEAYRAALTVCTRADHPVDWARTQVNLGVAYWEQGKLAEGSDALALFGKVREAKLSARQIYTRDDHPVDWAMVQENLAELEQTIAEHDTNDDPRPHLEAALAHVDAALEVYAPEHMPYDHGTATRLRDQIHAALGALPAPG